MFVDGRRLNGEAVGAGAHSDIVRAKSKEK